MTKQKLTALVVDTLPVMTGYLFLGFGFGILMHSSGYGFLTAVAMSLLIYAGSMQYAAVPLLTGGAGVLTVALTTLLVNARHLFYGISMVDAYKGAGGKKPYMIFALTDETYSLVSQTQPPAGMSRHGYCLAVSALNHSYWVTGTALGALAGSVLPIPSEGIEFILTALFVTIFTEQWLTNRDHRPALIGVGCALVCLWIFGRELFLIPAMILMTLSLIRMKGRKEEPA